MLALRQLQANLPVGENSRQTFEIGSVFAETSVVLIYSETVQYSFFS